MTDCVLLPLRAGVGYQDCGQGEEQGQEEEVKRATGSKLICIPPELCRVMLRGRTRIKATAPQPPQKAVYKPSSITRTRRLDVWRLQAVMQPLAAAQHEDGSGAQHKAEDACETGAQQLHGLVAVGVVPEQQSRVTVTIVRKHCISIVRLKAGQRLAGLRAHALCTADGHAES